MDRSDSKPETSEALRAVCKAAESIATGDFHSVINKIDKKNMPEEVERLVKALESIARSVEEQVTRYRHLTSIAEKINRGVRLEDVLDQIYDTFKGTIPYNRIGFALISDDEKRVEARWARTDQGEIKLDNGFRQRLERGSLAEVLATGKPRIINDTRRYLDKKPESDATRRMIAEGIRSSLTCPLTVLGRPVGFLFFSSTEPDTYREDHTEFFVQIAEQVAGIVHKSQLYEELLETKRQLEQANRKLEQMASLDGLTGIANRRVFDEKLLYQWRRATRSMAPLSLLMLDVDHFKQFNDTRGHQAGDDVLRSVARALEGCLHRAGDSVARYGGEEFVVLLAATPKEGAMVVGERLREAVAARQIAHPRSSAAAYVTVSVGVSSTLATRERNPGALVEAADLALYRAKEIGRNRVCYCDPGSNRPLP
jgi:diguanylate cyclase (GGDEF)-like protein